jgi:hypothetical protein
MNSHLTREQINQWIIGDRAPQIESHMATCAECSAEAARLEVPLGAFRDTVHRWSGRHLSPATAIVPRRSFSFFPRFAIATAALALMIAGGIDFHARRVAEMARADEALLEQVDAAVGRSVPAPFEPLAKLMSQSSSNNSQEGSAQ